MPMGKPSERVRELAKTIGDSLQSEDITFPLKEALIEIQNQIDLLHERHEVLINVVTGKAKGA